MYAMKKLIFTLAVTMLTMRSFAPNGTINPIISIVYSPTNNTVNVTASRVDPNYNAVLLVSTNLASTSWTAADTNINVPANGVVTWTNLPATNVSAFYRIELQ
jgi:hypothetical protein